MFISTVPGAQVRSDDDTVMARLLQCKEFVAARSTIYGLLNEAGLVYRLVICAAGAGAECVREALLELGFEERDPATTNFRGLVDLAFGKP